MKSVYRMKLLADLGKKAPEHRKRSSARRTREQSIDLRRTILVIDDEPDILEMLIELLETDNYKTLAALTVKEGITFLQSRSEISLVLCDLIMPEQDGFDMLRFLRNNLRFRDIPVVVCSGRADQTAIALAFKLGAKDCIAKPFVTELFLSRIRKIIDSGLGTLLIVTDDSSISKLLTAIVTRAGYRAITASCGEKALEILSNEKVSGILSELAMKDMTGLDLLSGAQNKRPGIPALFIGDPQISVEESDIVAAGGYGLLQRPFNNTDVVRRVAQLIFAT